MNRLPEKDKRARTGTNIRGNAWAGHLAKINEEQSRPFQREARAFRARFKKLFSKADLRVASDILNRIRREHHLTNLNGGPETSRWDANRNRLRKQLDRELARALPAYRKWQDFAKAHQRDYRSLAQLELAALTDKRVHIGWGDVLPPDAGETYEFTAPFTVFDTHHDDWVDTNVQDHSFAVPSIGHLVNNVVFAQVDDPLIFTDIYGINWPVRYISSATCGVNFTMPSAGRLRIAATLQNFYNKVTCSVRDCFGFSEANINVYLRLIIAVVQPNHVTELSTTLMTDGFGSFGIELSYQFPQLDTTSPYTFEATTEETFPANTGLQILAGSQVNIQSEIDDMETYANALLWWQLRKLTVNVV